ncbi:MAG: tetratricopeptide repeat protein [Gammaproteobacteria bacterium]|nr:tetratricopeptide repeat protein [Gammaproteobacteria bacterium]
MSLINQMLKDLESRSAETQGDGNHIIKGLASADMSGQGKIKTILFSGVVLAIIIAAVFSWQKGYYKQVSSLFLPVETQKNIAATAHVNRQPDGIIEPQPVISEHIKEQTPAPSSENESRVSGLYDNGIQQLLDVDLEITTANKIEQSKEEAVSVPAVVVEESQKKSGEIIRKNKPLSRAEQAEMSYQSAVRQLKDGYFSLALQSLKECLDVDPKHITARDLFANLLVRNQRMDEALTVLSDGIELYPYQLEFIQLYARVLAEKGLVEPALQMLERISPDVATQADYHALRATLYQQLGRYDRAIVIYQDVLRVKPDRGRWWMGLALSLEAKGDHKSALNAYRNVTLTSDLNYRMKTFAEQKVKELERK